MAFRSAPLDRSALPCAAYERVVYNFFKNPRHPTKDSRLTLEAMYLFRHIITIVCIITSFIADAGEQLTADGKCAVDLPTAPELQLLQGAWEGVDVGDPSHQKITITITNSSLHFYRDRSFWFDTTFTLSTGTDPKQIHATIKESANGDAKGELVGAIFKIEDGTLTLASYGTDKDDPPKTFASYPSRYVLKKAPPKKKQAEQSDAHETPPRTSVSMRQVLWTLDSLSTPASGGGHL